MLATKQKELYEHKVETVGDYKVAYIKYASKVTRDNSPEIKETIDQLVENGVDRIVFDMSKTQEADTVALAHIPYAQQKLGLKDGQYSVEIIKPDEESKAYSALKLAKFHQVYRIHNTIEDMIESYKNPEANPGKQYNKKPSKRKNAA